MKKTICTIFILFASVLYTEAAEGPVFSLEYPKEAIAPSSEFLVRLLVESEVPINALQATVFYSSDILELVSLNTGSSVVDVWVQNPDTKKAGTVFFEGGIRNIFQGRDGEVASFVFRVKRPGVAQVSVRDASVYYADGKGARTEAHHSIAFVTSNERGALLSFQNTDAKKPEFKEISLAENPIEKRDMVAFDVRDEGSGIKETQFRYRTGLLWSEWLPATNPVRLAEKTWVFQLKATDNLGNVALYTGYLPHEFLKSPLATSIASIVLILLAVVIIFFKKRRKIV